ncbi:Transcription elongation factor spt6 [Entamoeba marina]
MKRSDGNGKKKKEDSSDESSIELDELDYGEKMQEEIATTRDGYEDDGFVVDELEEDEIEITDEGMSEDEEDKEKRREERRRRKEEKELRRAEREKKKKTRKLVNVGDAVDDNQDIMEYDVINDEMNYEEEEEEDVNDENMVEVYDKYLEPYDKSKMQEEERIMDFMKINCPERLYFRKSVLNRQNSEFNENLDDSEWEDRRKLEADWIYKKLLLDLSRPTDLNGFINEVLKLMYVDLHEIMYIFTYDKDAIYQFFGEDWKIVNETHVLEMLWNVWRLDLEYFEFNKKRQSVINALQNISEIERVNYSRLLDNAVLDVELEMVREEFSLLFLSDTFDPLRRVTKNRKNYTDLLNYNLKEFVNAFGITPQQLSDNFKYGYKNSVPRPPYEEPEQIARRLVSNDLKTPKHVINAAKTLYMVELAHTYDFKKKILEFALDNAFLTTSPTPKGETEIDVYHKYAIIKRLADKPVKDFKNISKILEIFEAEKEGLVTVSFSLPNAIGDVVSVFTSDDDSNAWKSLKQETIDTMFKHFINPFIDTELRQQLRKEAVQCVIKEAQSSLKKRVFVQPHFKLTPKRNVLESRETDETVGGIVFGLNSVMVVVVNSVSKEFVDSLFLDPFVYRYEKYQKKLSDFFKLHKTVLIGIEANSPKSVFLFNKMHEDDGSDNSIRGLFNDVVYVNKDLGTIYKLEVTGESEQLIYSGVSLCRQLIDPLAEFVHIASAEDRIFSVQLHSLQNVLVGSERGSYYSGLNESLMEFVNIHGVNINDCIDYDHYKNMLQFVCGYSKLRSDNLLVNLKKFSYNVPSRDFLSKLYIRDGFSTISTNAIGFLIITPDYSKKR